MANEPAFASAGTATDDIEVRLSYRIVELFSEGLYTSPNKAVEELVANSFDAGAQTVHVILSPNLHDQDASIAVIDDGHGMDSEGLKQHWLIGISNKRGLAELPRDRKQIGKFGIGKLATYVLADRLTHISKSGSKYYSTSMNYRAIDRRVDRHVEPKSPIKIALRELTAGQAKRAVRSWIESAAFKATGATLFGRGSPKSWTVGIMSSLKPKVSEIKPGILKWVLRTALPLRPDFHVWLDGRKLVPSKEGRGRLKKWVLGKDLVKLPKPAPKGVTKSEDKGISASGEHHFGLNVPGIGRVTGYAEVYKELLTGKSDDIDRSHGFFVYIYGRLLNVSDGHFGISPDELRHGTFGRFRSVVHMDGLDEGLRSNRETIGEGPLLETAKDVLRAVFNAVRPVIETHDREKEPGARLASKLATSPASLVREPIIKMSRAVIEGKSKARHLIVPSHTSPDAREDFIADLNRRAREPEGLVTDVTIDFDGSSHDGIVRFDTETGRLRLNGWHPFIATFQEEFSNKRSGQPLELIAMAEVLSETHLHSIGVDANFIDEFLSARDQLLRHLANESGRRSALSVANALQDARNSPDRLEECMCDAFRSLGFDVKLLGKSGEPDGMAAAHLSADDRGNPRNYQVTLEAKSKVHTGAKVSANAVDVAAVIRHRDKLNCDHAVIVGPEFTTSGGDASALGESIKDDRVKSEKTYGVQRTITLIRIDDLARLVRLRPVKRVGLKKIRDLFVTCSLPEQSSSWVESIREASVTKPPYREIVTTIEKLQKEYRKEAVRYSALRVELSHLTPAIKYETNDEIAALCKAMAQMAATAMFASGEKVELDQSAENVIAAIEAALRDYPPDER